VKQLFNRHVLKLPFTSVFNNFPIVGWNIMKPAWCTHTHEGLSNSTKSVTWCGGDLNLTNERNKPCQTL
jgi:hypothetical protein